MTSKARDLADNISEVVTAHTELVDATLFVKGVVQLASGTEVRNGVNAGKVITPQTMRAIYGEAFIDPLAFLRVADITNITYNGDNTTNVITYSQGSTATHSYGGDGITSIVYTEVDGTTTKFTKTYGYTNGLLTTVTGA